MRGVISASFTYFATVEVIGFAKTYTGFCGC